MDIVKHYKEDKLFSEFYKDVDSPIAEYTYKNRKWNMYQFGECNIHHKELGYIKDLSSVCNNDKEFVDLVDNETIYLSDNNWYELRPIGRTDYYELGMYDEVYGTPDEITEAILDEYINLEKQIDKNNKKEE